MITPMKENVVNFFSSTTDKFILFFLFYLLKTVNDTGSELHVVINFPKFPLLDVSSNF